MIIEQNKINQIKFGSKIIAFLYKGVFIQRNDQISDYNFLLLLNKFGLSKDLQEEFLDKDFFSENENVAKFNMFDKISFLTSFPLTESMQIAIAGGGKYMHSYKLSLAGGNRITSQMAIEILLSYDDFEINRKLKINDIIDQTYKMRINSEYKAIRNNKNKGQDIFC
jgi:hypothetical protein